MGGAKVVSAPGPELVRSIMVYEAIDPILDRWAQDNDLMVDREPSGVHRRFVHTSSPRGETFQIVVEPEHAEIVRIDAHLIESLHDEEAHYVWEAPIDELRAVLEVVRESVSLWFDRPSR